MNDIDERYSVADEAIYEAFFILLKTKSMDRITVSDIIKKAGIVRATFYNHYENIPALVNAIEDKTINDIFLMLETFHPKNDKDMCKSYFLTICNYTMRNPFLSNLLKSPRGDEFFEKAMTMFHSYVTNISKNAEKSQISQTEFSYAVASSIGSTIGVLHKWISEDFKSSPDTVADILSKVFLSGMLPLIQSGPSHA